MTIIRLRAGLGILFAVVPLMAGAQAAQAQATDTQATETQAAQACPEPVLRNLPARGTQKELVRFRLAEVTPGSDYLVRVAGRERKNGVATADRVSRRFRMPNLGQDKQRVWVEVVVANDTCENGPWKFAEKITYEPAPVPEPPSAQPTPTPTPTPTPDPSPNLPVAPSPPAAPSLTSPAPKSQPNVPAPTVKPTTPTPSPTTPAEPPRDGRAWVTPADPSAKASDPPLEATKGALARTELPSDPANSTAALLGLAGFFFLLVGIATIGWTRFRRYDEQRLDEILNPEGKLPTHLDPKAKDAVDESSVPKTRIPKFARKPAAVVAAGAGVVAAVAGSEEAKKDRKARKAEKAAEREAKKAAKTPGRRGGQGKGAMGQLTAEQKAAMTDEEKEAFRQEWKRKRRLEGKRKKKAPLPRFDPTAADAPEGPTVVTHGPMAKSPPKKPKKGLLRRGKQAPEAATPAAVTPEAAPAPVSPAPQPATPAPKAAEPEPAAPQPTPVPPAAASNGVPANGATANGVPANGVAQPPNGDRPPDQSYRAEVETELQRILNDAGLHAEVDGILADAKAEAERQGVPIDSELMLKALCEETNGAAKLSDTTKGELESRFRRIVAEERGEGRPTPGS